MKTTCSTLLGVMISLSLFAQSPPAAPSDTPPPSVPLSKTTVAKIAKMTPIFDGATLDGWVQAPPYATTLGGDDITDLPAFAAKLAAKADPVSAFINSQLDDAVRTDLGAFSEPNANLKTAKSAFMKNLNKIVSGPSIYDEARFQNVHLRSWAADQSKQHPEGVALARLNRMLLEDAYPKELATSPAASWTVKDGAMASTGAGRGTIYTKHEYGSYRIIFNIRHVSGKPDHQACVLIYCTTPPDGEKGMDALGGVQFQVPNGGTWDYRKGKNNDGKGLFTKVPHPKFNIKEWSQVEILVDAKNGIARMAVAQPVGMKAVEVLDFKDPTAGKTGPFALQMHNAGLFDEYKDLRVELDPKDNELITLK